MEQHSSESPLKILFISSWYPNSEQPTLGNFVQKHAQAAAMYNRVSVITVVSSASHTDLRIEKRQERNVDEYIAYFPKSKVLFSKALNFLRNRKAFLAAYDCFCKDHGKPDLIHLNVCYPLGVWALHLKRKYGIPYVITEHSSGFHLGTDHAYPQHILTVCKKIFAGASYILPVSQDLQRSLKKLAPKGHFDIISNVVDEQIFLIGSASDSEKKRFIHISTGVDSIKNLSGMIRTVDSLSQKRRDFLLDIVSDGDIEYAKELAKEIHDPSLIRFHATKTTEEIADMLQKSDALVLFSNYENFPCVIPEAFMSGKPVISTAVNGIPEHVNAKNGILIEKNNELQLADAMEKVLNGAVSFDPNGIRHYAMENFSYATVGRKLDNIYRKVVASNASDNAE